MQFEGFYMRLYDLKETELRTTQPILIDKEYSLAPAEHTFSLLERHMRPGDPFNPPLMPYDDGK